MFQTTGTARTDSLVREVSQSVALLGLTGASVGGFLAIINVATKALGQ